MSGFEIFIIVCAIGAGSFVKAVTGMGLPIIAIPIMALFVDVETAVVVMALPGTLSNGILASRERSHYSETRQLLPMMAFGIIGAVLGTILLRVLPDRVLLFGLAGAVIAYLAKSVANPEFRINEATSRRWTPVVGTVAGLFQGAVGISGPIVATWFYSFRLPRNAHILSLTSMFLLTGLTQLLVFAVDGRLREQGWPVLLAVIPMMLMLPLGARVRDQLTGAWFDRLVKATLALSAATLIFRAFS